MPSRIDGPKHGILAKVRDNVPRIWCSHCDAHNLTVGDASRHYRDSHPQYALAEKPYWCVEIYVNSRHGANSAAQLARTRVQQVIAFLNGGPPVAAAPVVAAAPGVNVYAVLAGSLPGKCKAIKTHLAGTIVTQAAPPLAGAAAINVNPLPAAAAAINVNPPAVGTAVINVNPHAPLPAASLATVVLANAPAQLPAQPNVPGGFASAHALLPASINGNFPFGYAPGFGTGDSYSQNTARPSFGQVGLSGQYSARAPDDESDGEGTESEKQKQDDDEDGHNENMEPGTDKGRLSKLKAFFPNLYEGGTITNNHAIDWTLEYENCIVMSNRAAARATNCSGQTTRLGMTKADKRFHRGMARDYGRISRRWEKRAEAIKQDLNEEEDSENDAMDVFEEKDDEDDAMDVSEESREEF